MTHEDKIFHQIDGKCIWIDTSAPKISVNYQVKLTDLNEENTDDVVVGYAIFLVDYDIDQYGNRYFLSLTTASENHFNYEASNWKDWKEDMIPGHIYQMIDSNRKYDIIYLGKYSCFINCVKDCHRNKIEKIMADIRAKYVLVSYDFWDSGSYKTINLTSLGKESDLYSGIFNYNLEKRMHILADIGSLNDKDFEKLQQMSAVEWRPPDHVWELGDFRIVQYCRDNLFYMLDEKTEVVNLHIKKIKKNKDVQL